MKKRLIPMVSVAGFILMANAHAQEPIVETAQVKASIAKELNEAVEAVRMDLQREKTIAIAQQVTLEVQTLRAE